MFLHATFSQLKSNLTCGERFLLCRHIWNAHCVSENRLTPQESTAGARLPPPDNQTAQSGMGAAQLPMSRDSPAWVEKRNANCALQAVFLPRVECHSRKQYESHAKNLEIATLRKQIALVHSHSVHLDDYTKFLKRHFFFQPKTSWNIIKNRSSSNMP